MDIQRRMVCVVICLICCYFAYQIGTMKSKTVVQYVDRPVFHTDTVSIIVEKVTNANVSKDEPPIISDSLALDDIMKNMYVKYTAEPIIKDSLISYRTFWKHNIEVVKELYIDTFRVDIIKKDLKTSCLFGMSGFTVGVLTVTGILFYILTK